MALLKSTKFFLIVAIAKICHGTPFVYLQNSEKVYNNYNDMEDLPQSGEKCFEGCFDNEALKIHEHENDKNEACSFDLSSNINSNTEVEINFIKSLLRGMESLKERSDDDINQTDKESTDILFNNEPLKYISTGKGQGNDNNCLSNTEGLNYGFQVKDQENIDNYFMVIDLLKHLLSEDDQIKLYDYLQKDELRKDYLAEAGQGNTDDHLISTELAKGSLQDNDQTNIDKYLMINVLYNLLSDQKNAGDYVNNVESRKDYLPENGQGNTDNNLISTEFSNGFLQDNYQEKIDKNLIIKLLYNLLLDQENTDDYSNNVELQKDCLPENSQENIYDYLFNMEHLKDMLPEEEQEYFDEYVNNFELLKNYLPGKDQGNINEYLSNIDTLMSFLPGENDLEKWLDFELLKKYDVLKTNALNQETIGDTGNSLFNFQVINKLLLCDNDNSEVLLIIKILKNLYLQGFLSFKNIIEGKPDNSENLVGIELLKLLISECLQNLDSKSLEDSGEVSDSSTTIELPKEFLLDQSLNSGIRNEEGSYNIDHSSVSTNCLQSSEIAGYPIMYVKDIENSRKVDDSLVPKDIFNIFGFDGLYNTDFKAQESSGNFDSSYAPIDYDENVEFQGSSNTGVGESKVSGDNSNDSSAADLQFGSINSIEENLGNGNNNLDFAELLTYLRLQGLQDTDVVNKGSSTDTSNNPVDIERTESIMLENIVNTGPQSGNDLRKSYGRMIPIELYENVELGEQCDIDTHNDDELENTDTDSGWVEFLQTYGVERLLNPGGQSNLETDENNLYTIELLKNLGVDPDSTLFSTELTQNVEVEGCIKCSEENQEDREIFEGMKFDFGINEDAIELFDDLHFTNEPSEENPGEDTDDDLWKVGTLEIYECKDSPCLEIVIVPMTGEWEENWVESDTHRDEFLRKGTLINDREDLKKL